MENNNYRRRLEWWFDNNNHRNAFCLWVGDGRTNQHIVDLVSYGLMKPGQKINDGDMQYFHVTVSGIKLAREEFFRERARAKT